MIEWTTARTAEIEVYGNGDEIDGSPLAVGYPDGEHDPNVIAVGIFHDGEGMVIEGTPDELRQFLARATAALDAHESDRSN